MSDLDLSVDLRDALGDRVYLTGTVRRDGVRRSLVQVMSLQLTNRC